MTKIMHVKIKNEHHSYKFLALLLITDIFFAGFHIVEKLIYNCPDDSLFLITTDRGYAEFYQYMKYFWIITLFAIIIISSKCYNYISWILTFIYFLSDDAIEIHEQMGGRIASNFNLNLPFNLRLQDVGELIVSATAGMILLLILIFSYVRGSHIFKKISKDLAIFIVALVFFGVIADILHVVINIKKIGLGLIEDGGEMVVVSLILWYVYLTAIHCGDPGFFLYDRLHKFITRNNT